MQRDRGEGLSSGWKCTVSSCAQRWFCFWSVSSLSTNSAPNCSSQCKTWGEREGDVSSTAHHHPTERTCLQVLSFSGPRKFLPQPMDWGSVLGRSGS